MTEPSPPPRRLVAVGLGSRSGAHAGAVSALVAEVLASHRATPVGFYTHAAKVDDTALIGAALRFGHPLEGIPAEALAARDAETLTRSAASLNRFGLSSLSECAALAGGGRGARLIAPRVARDGITVALAEMRP